MKKNYFLLGFNRFEKVKRFVFHFQTQCDAISARSNSHRRERKSIQKAEFLH
jgi:hypothetical protein